MKMTSKWRQAQNEDNLKIKMTSKLRKPQMTSKWRQPQNEDFLRMKTILKRKKKRLNDYLKMKTSSKRRNTISNNFLLCYLSKPFKSFLPNQTFQTKLSKPNIPNLQTYQTKPRRVKDAQKKETIICQNVKWVVEELKAVRIISQNKSQPSSTQHPPPLRV